MSVAMLRYVTWALLCVAVQLHSVQPSIRFRAYPSPGAPMGTVSVKSAETLVSAGCAFTYSGQLNIDLCGICGGDNSTCQKVQNVLSSTLGTEGYNHVMSIPAGATNVEIVKGPTWPDANWLAVKNSYGNYVFEGKSSGDESQFDYDGAQFNYSSLLSNTAERLTITGKVPQTLQVEVFTTGQLHIPKLQYSYWISALKEQPETRFEWVPITTWSTCNRLCGGMQKQKVVCNRITRTGLWIEVWRVDAEQCRHLPLPSAVLVRPCNTYCELQWFVTSIGNCSQPCGPGLQARQVVCLQLLADTQHSIATHHCEHELAPKPSSVLHCEVAKCKTSKWAHLARRLQRVRPLVKVMLQ